jgi:hypothetical protein
VKYENAHTKIKPLFAGIIKLEHAKNPGITVGIDDDDAEDIEKQRGSIHIYSTLEICIEDTNHSATQRLTPEEAKLLARRLILYAEFIEEMNEDIQEVVDDMEGLA